MTNVNKYLNILIMKKNILETFLGKKGQFCKIVSTRPLKTLKAFSGLKIVKYSILNARCGCEYDAQKAVIEKRESGELPAENQGLPFGEWEIFKYTIVHKGQRYLRFSTIPGSFGKSVYFLNGKRVKKEDIAPFCLASEFAEKKQMDVFVMKEESILALK